MNSVAQEVVMSKMKSVIVWLEKLGLKGTNTRYSRYEKIIDSFYKTKEPPTEQERQENYVSAKFKQEFRDMTYAFRECMDIVMIYRCFSEVTEEGFVNRLRHVISGQEVPDLEKAGGSRNYLFELLIAARFKAAGYEIDFSHITDVVATKQDLVVYAECKRLSSGNSLGKNIKEAAVQLEIAFANLQRKPLGLTFVDISSCIQSELPLYFDSEWSARKHLERERGLFFNEKLELVKNLLEKYSEFCKGVCFVSQLPIWMKASNWVPDYGMFLMTELKVSSPESMNDEDFSEVERALVGLDSLGEYLR